MLSAMEYPHWLMVAGAVLVVLGFIGLALRQKKDVELDDEQTEMKANEKRDGRHLNATTLPPLAMASAASSALNSPARLFWSCDANSRPCAPAQV
jgi:hypothetical protein